MNPLLLLSYPLLGRESLCVGSSSFLLMAQARPCSPGQCRKEDTGHRASGLPHPSLRTRGEPRSEPLALLPLICMRHSARCGKAQAVDRAGAPWHVSV